MNFKQIGSVLFFLLICAPVVSLAGLTLTVSQLRTRLVQHEADVSTLNAQLGAAYGQITRLEAEMSADVLQKEERAQHDARASALTSQLTAARGEIERLNAEAATNAKIKEELAQQHTTAASFVQELTVARGEIERLKAEAAANTKVQEEPPQPHTTAASLAQELAAARDEIERLRAEAGAAVERARFWRSRFVAELQRNEPASDPVKSSWDLSAPSK
jgi:chromosome segregation ATPase